MPTFPASAVTGSLLTTALDMHAPSNPGSQFPICYCGHSSMDVYRPRHLREVVRKTAGTVLVPTPLLGDPSEHAMALVTAALTVSSVEQHKALMPLAVTARALMCAYSPTPDIPLLDPDAIVTTLDETLHLHSVADMLMDAEGKILLRCHCGFETDEDLFEAHRAAEVAKAGCVYGTRSEMHATYRALMVIADNLPSGLLRSLSMETNGMFQGMTRLRSHLKFAAE